jgi:MFS family permease
MRKKLMEHNRYKNYLLVILLVVLAFNFMDRLALGLLLQSIKVDLELSDTQLGFLSGIAFALFYSVMGIPIARWADRGNRVTIISVTTGLWSIAVISCGMATTFLQLLLARVGVAVGEAGCIPPAHSLIADFFTRAERPKAVARYMLGAPLSFVFGYFAAGWLNEVYGWRATFALLGVPGLLLAMLTRLTLREPRLDKRMQYGAASGISKEPRTVAAPKRMESHDQPSLKLVCVTLWHNTTFRHLMFSFSVMHFFTYGILQWQPTFFIRSYGLETGFLGTWLAVIYALGGLIGTFCGGEWAARRAAHNEQLQLRAVAIVYAGFGLISTLVYLAPNHHLAFLVMGLAWTGINTANGPIFATIQTLVPPRMRAMSIAVIYFFSNLIGMGLGPLAAGALSDALRPILGDESLRYALLALCPGYMWGAWHVWRGSTAVARDVAAMHCEGDQHMSEWPAVEGIPRERT